MQKDIMWGCSPAATPPSFFKSAGGHGELKDKAVSIIYIF